MSVDAIGSNYQNQPRSPAVPVGTEQEKPGSSAEINQLNAEIKQAESEIKETAKEVQKAVCESVEGSSEKVQMLQNKMQMQQQAVLMKQLKIKEIESPSKSAAEQRPTDVTVRPRVDQYIAGEDTLCKADPLYHVEEKDGIRTITFNTPED